LGGRGGACGERAEIPKAIKQYIYPNRVLCHYHLRRRRRQVSTRASGIKLQSHLEETRVFRQL